MRRITVIGGAVLASAATSDAALADAGPNAHNCAGSFSSAVTPQFTAGGAFGQSVAAQAQAGTRDDAIRVLVDALANCGRAR